MVPPLLRFESLTADTRSCLVGESRRKYSASSLDWGMNMRPYSSVSGPCQLPYDKLNPHYRTSAVYTLPSVPNFPPPVLVRPAQLLQLPISFDHMV